MRNELIVIDDKLKRGENLEEYKDVKKIDLLIELLEYKIRNYDRNEDYNYLSRIFKIIPDTLLKLKNHDSKEIISGINAIHYFLRERIEIEKENDREVSNFLKDTIDNIEALTLALNYDYLTEYHGNKYSLMEFLIFKLKNPVMIEDAIKRFPYIVNLVDEEGKSLFSRVVDNYIESAFLYSVSVKDNLSNDEIIYYDSILALFLTSKELYIDYLYERETIKNIEYILDNTDFSNKKINQESLVFWLDLLKENLERKEVSNSFLYEDLLYKYGIRSNFPIVINKEAKRIMSRFDSAINCLEKNDKEEFVITIDGDDAYEIDDALSVKKLDNGNYLLGVHIANPTRIIEDTNLIFDEAKKRTTSIYLSDRTISMYPDIVSKQTLSLSADKYNLAMLFYLEIEPSTCDVVNFSVFEKSLKVNKNLTYDNVNSYLVNKPDDYLLAKTLEELEIVSEILDKRLKIEDFYRKLYRSTNDKKKGLVFTKSKKVVELAMLIANYQAAVCMNKNNYPFIYRNHKVNQEEALEISNIRQLFKEEDDVLRFEKHFNFLQSMYPRAYLSTLNEGHFGLGLSHYSHVTSPLRRMEDNLNHIAIRKFLLGKPTDKEAYYIEELLNREANYINKRRKPIEDFSNYYELGKRLVKLKKD